jgi:aldose sugar dehydrogenase
MHHSFVARAARCALPFVLLATAACGSSPQSSTPPPPGTPSPPSAGDNTVVGSERIGWEQGLLVNSAPNDYTFTWIIDDVRAGPASATCTAQSGTTLSCSAPIPALTPGIHQLRLMAIRSMSAGRVESSRSGALTVVQLGSAVPALTPGAVASTAEITGDRIPASLPADSGGAATERISVVARGLGPVSDVATAGDLVIVAERQGALRLVRDGSMLPEPALALDDVVATAPGLGLLGVTAHPDFAKNRQIYFLYTAETRTGIVYRLARGREVDGQIGELAVVLDGVEAGLTGWAALRFGPDGKLYAAFAAPADGVRPGSYAGHVLRLNDDGTTPRDNPGATPVIGETGGAPLALVWTDSGELGIVRALPDGRRDFRRSLTQADGEQPWRADEQPAGASYYRADLLAKLSGKLLVGLMDGGVGLMDAPPAGITRRIGATYGAARALAIAESGEIYIGTANGDVSARTASPGRDDVLLCVRDNRR